MCANSATHKYFSFLEHFSGNILHSTSLMTNTFLSSHQIHTQISMFPSCVLYLITGIIISSYLQILYVGYFTISSIILQLPKYILIYLILTYIYLRKRWNIATSRPQKIGSTIRECEVWRRHNWNGWKHRAPQCSQKLLTMENHPVSECPV